ncbi:MAG: DUF6470 family protein [Negativicutes bacterium]|nr:DUF6470 family protein [Negativicutes bacterium]
MAVDKVSNMPPPPSIQAVKLAGELEIDQTPSRESYGVKTCFAWRLEISAQARQMALAGIGRIAAEGDRLARIESGEDAIVNMAAESNLAAEAIEIGITAVARPIIKYHPSSPQMIDLSA